MTGNTAIKNGESEIWPETSRSEKSSTLDGCQHIDRVSVLIRDVPRENKIPRRPLSATPCHARRFGGVSVGGMSYEVIVGEPLKGHLITRMVTSSLKVSPQKSAAEL